MELLTIGTTLINLTHVHIFRVFITYKNEGVWRRMCMISNFSMN